MDFYESIKSDRRGSGTSKSFDEGDPTIKIEEIQSPTTEKDFLKFAQTEEEEEDLQLDSPKVEENPLPPLPPKPPTPPLTLALNYSNTKCSKCTKIEYINDRSEVLSEINLNLKLEIESLKRDFRQELNKNSELNFEIANIETALENYYSESKTQKSTLSTLYASVKNQSQQKNYTYIRIKAISDYVEIIKAKLQHQDRIIKKNFTENPYYTDFLMKTESLKKQLDDLSIENQQLKDQLRHKALEELDIIKELNRQKFQIEHKAKQLETQFLKELKHKDLAQQNLEEDHQKQIQNFQKQLEKKDEELLKLRQLSEARVNNYKQELLIVYKKWKEQKKLVD